MQEKESQSNLTPSKNPLSASPENSGEVLSDALAGKLSPKLDRRSFLGVMASAIAAGNMGSELPKAVDMLKLEQAAKQYVEMFKISFSKANPFTVLSMGKTRVIMASAIKGEMTGYGQDTISSQIPYLRPLAKERSMENIDNALNAMRALTQREHVLREAEKKLLDRIHELSGGQNPYAVIRNLLGHPQEPGALDFLKKGGADTFISLPDKFVPHMHGTQVNNASLSATSPYVPPSVDSTPSWAEELLKSYRRHYIEGTLPEFAEKHLKDHRDEKVDMEKIAGKDYQSQEGKQATQKDARNLVDFMQKQGEASYSPSDLNQMFAVRAGYGGEGTSHNSGRLFNALAQTMEEGVVTREGAITPLPPLPGDETGTRLDITQKGGYTYKLAAERKDAPNKETSR